MLCIRSPYYYPPSPVKVKVKVKLNPSSPVVGNGGSGSFSECSRLGRYRRHRYWDIPVYSASVRAPSAELGIGDEVERESGREDDDEEEEEEENEMDPVMIRWGLQRETLPRHVAVIMDGNSRWARARGLPPSAGHEAGYRSLTNIVNLSCKWGIRTLSVFAFSSENWLRPKAEVDFLMMLFRGVLKENIEDFMSKGIRLCIIGDLAKLPKSLQKLAKEVEELTSNNSQLDLIVAISYGGRSDIVQACQKIAQKVEEGLLVPADITEYLIAHELETNCIIESPYPDLLIRTSGELRLSNFFLWQSAYTELYFSEAHWPDFGEADYAEALRSFQRRQRRFGQRTVKI